MWWKQYERESCVFEHTCPYVGTDKCKRTCGWYHEGDLSFSVSNLPPAARKDLTIQPEKVDYEAYTICKSYMENIEEHVSKGQGIYLFSNNKGNGKTTWAYKFAIAYMKIIAKKHSKGSVYYVNVSELFETLRVNMNNKDVIENIERRILGSSLVIFDDLGVEAPTDWVSGKLYNYINYRYSQNKTMIFTSNLRTPDLYNHVGDRVVDRILEVCRPVEFNGQTRRDEKRWWLTDDRTTTT